MTSRTAVIVSTAAVTALVAATLLPGVARAERDRGGSRNDGGGRLGQVSSGMRAATGGGNVGGAPNRDDWQDRSRDCCTDDHTVVYVGAGGVPPPPGPTQPSNVRVDAYVGVQKVHESDGSLSAELSLNERRFRFGGAITRYIERQDGRDALALTVPSLVLGARLDGGGPTRVYVEGGAVFARTSNDPVMDTSLSGFIGGARLEHRMGRFAVLADAHAMAFEQDVRGRQLRVGVRAGHLQASLRYFDLNVGPALYGPEIGLAF